jgi:hypothetical protein
LHSLTDDGARVGFLVNDAVGALVTDMTGTATGLTGVTRGEVALTGATSGLTVGIFVDPLTGAIVRGLDDFAGPSATGALVGGFEGTFVGAIEGGFDGTLVGAFVGGFDGTLGALVGGFEGTVVGALIATAKVLACPGVPLLTPLP